MYILCILQNRFFKYTVYVSSNGQMTTFFMQQKIIDDFWYQYMTTVSCIITRWDFKHMYHTRLSFLTIFSCNIVWWLYQCTTKFSWIIKWWCSINMSIEYSRDYLDAIPSGGFPISHPSIITLRPLPSGGFPISHPSIITLRHIPSGGFPISHPSIITLRPIPSGDFPISHPSIITLRPSHQGVFPSLTHQSLP